MRGHVVRAAVVAAAAIASMAFAAAAAAATNGKIAYVKDGVIHTVAPDGSGDTALAAGHHPTWSPDGRRIAFVRDGGVWVMNGDGSAATRLTDGAQPTWSPDGQWLAFARRTGTGVFASDVYRMRADGSGVQRLGTGSEPAWSPDGTTIAFTDAGGDWSSVYAMSTDGSNRRELIRDVSEAEWSPDGTRLAVVCAVGRGICTYTTGGALIAQLASTSQTIGRPSWAPDGSRVIWYQRIYKNYCPFCGDEDVLARVPDGSAPAETLLGADEVNESAPHWQPVPAAAGSNLLRNGSFESGLTGWYGWRARLALVEEGPDGTRAAEVAFNGTGTSYSINATPRPVSATEAGQTYVARAWVRGSGKQVCLRLREYDASGALVGAARRCLTARSEWAQTPAVVLTARGGGSLDLYLYQSSAATGDSFRVDGVTLAAEAPPERPLLRNGSFEGSLDGWYGWRAELSLVEGGADGSFSADVAFAGTGSSYSINATPRPVAATTAGAVYTASAFVRGSGKTVCLRLREYDGGGALVRASHRCVAAGAEWTRIEGVTLTAVGGGSLDLYLYQLAAEAGDRFGVDGVTLTAG
ncbi:MAG TPA: hypothetical protein VM290_07075 [Gaiellaceae bacterium]|nr:hypothetical protein [Gaiellaceae bacterium]